jgi:hypothetical protein
MVVSDILILKPDGSIEKSSIYTLPAQEAIKAYINNKNFKIMDFWKFKEINAKQSANNPRIWTIEQDNGDIISAIERV